MLSIDEYPKTVLDDAIPVIDELVKKGEAIVETSAQSLQPETSASIIGRTADIARLIRELYPYVDIDVTLKNFTSHESSFHITGKKGRDVERYKLQITIDGKKRFSLNRNENFVHTTILDCKEELEYPSKISVNARNTMKMGEGFRLDEILRTRLPKDHRPKERRKISLYFSYRSISPYPVETFYDDSEPLELFKKKRAGIIGFDYPVLDKEINWLDSETWHFISRPIYWDGRGQWVTQALNILAGNQKIDDIQRRYGTPQKMVEYHIQNVIQTSHWLMDRDHGTDEICDQLKCPKAYRSVFLKKPLKTIRYFANLKQEIHYAENLVNSYNEHAGYGKPPITSEGLRRLCERRIMDIN